MQKLGALHYICTHMNIDFPFLFTYIYVLLLQYHRFIYIICVIEVEHANTTAMDLVDHMDENSCNLEDLIMYEFFMTWPFNIVNRSCGHGIFYNSIQSIVSMWLFYNNIIIRNVVGVEHYLCEGCHNTHMCH